MKLRKLRREDGPLMLEWMHDPQVVQFLGADFAGKTLEDCTRFIESSWEDRSNLHLAIADEQDAYMGTVSLKHTDFTRGTAEFAITIRACAMGRGYSRFGMEEILKMGIEALHLGSIYWCVSRENARAVRFYDKCGYCRTEDVPDPIREAYTPEQNSSFLWYVYPKNN